MQLTNLIHLVYLVLYFLVAGQAVFYFLCFLSVFSDIPPQQFINIRKLADPILALRLSLIYYSSLASGAIFVLLMFLQPGTSAKAIALASYLLLLTDVILAKRHNIPLNTRIRVIKEPSDKEASYLQAEWLKWIRIRGIVVVAGFVLLLVQATGF
jgi:hypothetical protein